MPYAEGIHYSLYESGSLKLPPLVLIHDIGGDISSWPAEVRRMGGVQVFSLDLPGHGKSEGPCCQNVPDYAAEVQEFILSTVSLRAILVGHGLGGAVALSLALDCPELVAGIGLICSGAVLPIASSILDDAANPATFKTAVQSLLEKMRIPAENRKLMAEMFAQLTSIRPTLLHGDLCACNQFDVTSRLQDIQCPTLVLCGTEDQLTLRRFSVILAETISGAMLQTFEGAGHQLMFEQPRRVMGLLSLFQKTISNQAGNSKIRKLRG